MKISLNKSDSASVLTLKGAMDCNELEQLQEALMVSLSMSHHVIVYFNKDVGNDGECLKTMIHTVQKAARKLNKRLTLNGTTTA